MPKPQKAYPVSLVGTQRYPEATSWAAVGDPVTLLREPDNPHDGEAIVAVDGEGRTLGYVPRTSWLRRALIEEEKGARVVVAEADFGGLVVSVTLVEGAPIGWRDYESAP